LQLAGLSMKGRDDVADFIASFAGDDRFVVDYLVEEVLERQTDEVRDFLLHTSILSRLTGSLCDAVTGRDDASAMLETLDRANLFLVPLDDRRAWYRYHHLFGEVLRVRLLGSHPDRVSELHRRASDWYAANDDQPEAIGHAMAAEDHARAAELIELAIPMMRQARQEVTVRRWLEALPSEVFEIRPVLTMGLVGAHMSTGSIEGAEALLDSIERWFEPVPADDGSAPTAQMVVADQVEFVRLPAQAAIQRAGLALMADDTAGTIAHANRALDLLVTDGLIRGAASALIGLAEWRLGDLEAARSRYAEAVATFVHTGFLADVLGCSVALADLQIAQGRLADARRTFEDGLALDRDHGPLRGAADMHVGVAELLRERNELDAALDHLHASEGLGEHAGLPQNAYRWRVASARISQARGDFAGALELLDQAERVYNTDFSPDVRPIAATRARMRLARGDVASAQKWAQERGLTAADELTYVREYEHVTLARTLLAQPAVGRDSDLMGLLHRLLDAAEAGQRGGSAIEIMILQALAHHARGDSSSALATLEQALERAEPAGYVRIFLDEGAPMAALLRAAARQGVAVHHARRLLADLDAGPPAASQQVLVDELSGRELEVLRLLRSDLSGPDIARELLVSLNTMRTHTKNIFTKLGVNNRREAVRRAAELGL
jgi:LuxR family maltose regulon positive regulatory protein